MTVRYCSKLRGRYHSSPVPESTKCRGSVARSRSAEGCITLLCSPQREPPLAKVPKELRMGRYPVQRQRFPSKCCSTSSAEGFLLFSSKAYMFITQPGVQKPHWEPLPAAMADWMGWKPLSLQPMPWVVMMWQPSTAQRRRRQLLMGTSSTDFVEGLKRPSATVQMPHPPSWQPARVPLSPFMSRSQSRRRTFGDGFCTTTSSPLTQN
mmetsp:Transcript_75907/g.158287  ORF Transcript_75907/g.158287 Transcript_75907/m.158287 type:complete len:208 (+) Transcript_75907:3455-4078(+)